MDDPHAELEIKPQLKPRGSVVKEEDPKPSDQQYKLQIKWTQSAKQTLSMEYKKKLYSLYISQKKIYDQTACLHEKILNNIFRTISIMI